jgi:hypothetical protein
MSRSQHIDYADIPDLFVTIARVGGHSPLVQSGRGLPSRATLMAIRLASSFVSAPHFRRWPIARGYALSAVARGFSFETSQGLVRVG